MQVLLLEPSVSPLNGVVCAHRSARVFFSGMESVVEVISGEKRPPDDGELEGQPAGKKVKAVVGGNVKKVAELVLVLAAMGKMRGGRSPTDAEKEMMAEARDKLAEVCQMFAPKDVFPRDAFGGVIEDLGLNKLKEQRLGFRPPKMSIAEKMLLSKRKVWFFLGQEYIILLIAFSLYKTCVLRPCNILWIIISSAQSSEIFNLQSPLKISY